MFLRNSTDLSELSGTQIVEVGKPGIPGLPNLTFLLRQEGFFSPIDMDTRGMILNPQFNLYSHVNKVTYKPADIFMTILDLDALLEDPKLTDQYPKFKAPELLKYIKYVPACLSVTKSGTTEYYMPVIISIQGSMLVPYYTKFDGTLEDFRKACQKEVSVISSSYYYFYPTLDRSVNDIDDIFKDEQTRKLSADYNTIELSKNNLIDIRSILYKDYTNAENGILSLNGTKQNISSIRNSCKIGLKSELIELHNALPFTMCGLTQIYTSMIMPHKIIIRPGNAPIISEGTTDGYYDIKSADYYDFSVKYNLDKIIDVSSGSSQLDNIYIEIYAALHYGAKAMSEYDKSGNYITEITVNN